jgi:hypothetical protein
VSEELCFKKFIVSSFCRMAVNFEDYFSGMGDAGKSLNYL